MAPFEASIVVFVDGGSRRGIVDREATVGKVRDYVSYVDDWARTHVCCTDVCFA